MTVQAKTSEEKLKTIRETFRDELDVVLSEAKTEAFNSRDAAYNALAKSYVWYQGAINLNENGRAGREYLKVKFENNAPPIKKKAGVSDYNCVVKLVFDMTAPKYASTVSKYTMTLEYLDRVLATSDHDELRLDPGYVAKQIEKVGGIEDCIKKQRAWLNEQNEDDRKNDKKVTKHLKDLSTDEYRNRKKIGSAMGRSVPTRDGFVLLLGRTIADGSEASRNIDVIDVLETDHKEVDRYVSTHALKDTSPVGATINLLGDTLELASVIKGTPVTTVEQGGDVLTVSLGSDFDASVVVRAKPKNGALPGFAQRATLGTKGREWFEKNVSEAPRRRLFQVQGQPPAKAVAEFVFTNVVTQDKKVLHFNAPTENTKRQVIRDDTAINAWQFEFDMHVSLLEHIYVEWLMGWKGAEKDDKEKRIISIVFAKDTMTFDSSGSKKTTYAVNTGIQNDDSFGFRFRGDELVGIVHHLRKMPEVVSIRLRGHDSGVLEWEVDNSLATYMVDLPTVLSDLVNHNPKNFAKLA